jgi:hypothetical protein
MHNIFRPPTRLGCRSPLRHARGWAWTEATKVGTALEPQSEDARPQTSLIRHSIWRFSMFWPSYRLFKWIRILFRCWKDRKPYDEMAYQQTLAARFATSSPSDAASAARTRAKASCGTGTFSALSRNVKEWVKLCGIDRERVYKDSGLAGVSGLPA